MLAMPSLREKLGVLREPNRLLHLAWARRHAHRLAKLEPWAAASTTVSAASDGVRPIGGGRPCRRLGRRCYGSQTDSLVWLGPEGVLVGLPTLGHGQQTPSMSVRHPAWFDRLEEAGCAATQGGREDEEEEVRLAMPPLRKEEKKKKKKKRGKERKKKKEGVPPSIGTRSVVDG